jgi:hypothetical protein
MSKYPGFKVLVYVQAHLHFRGYMSISIYIQGLYTCTRTYRYINMFVYMSMSIFMYIHLGCPPKLVSYRNNQNWNRN